MSQRRASFGGNSPDFKSLVRVYLLDGSSKVLQCAQDSTAEDVLSQLKYNMDLVDVSTYALFRVVESSIRRIDLSEKMKEVLQDLTGGGQEIKLLYRSWITAKCGGFEKQVFQDNTRHKEPTTALWLSFMEASFMCFTGRYYLSEEESILLGCLKMQAESGDFKPEIHTIDIIRHRVASRFPNPARNKMRALLSPTLSGGGLADALAYRVQHLYARIAGKHKAEAQIEFLLTLRTWCPFYGATFFSVQCQFDDGLEEEEPPVTSVHAAVGPLAIFLITQQEPPMILRHPYKRILKWIAYKDKHIFHYWVIKSHIKISDIEEAQALHNKDFPSEDFNPQQFCDCVYLVLPTCGELEYLVRSYVNLLRDVMPKLKGAKGDLLPFSSKLRRTSSVSKLQSTGGVGGSTPTYAVDEIPEKPAKKRAKRFEKLFRAIGAYEEEEGDEEGSPRNSTSSASKSGRRSSVKVRRRSLAAGSGIDADSDNDEDAPGFGDDSALVSKSLFQSIYKSTRRSIRSADSNSSSDEGGDMQIPAQVKFAASMSELQRIAMEERFSDEDSDGHESSSSGSDDDEDEYDNSCRRAQRRSLAGRPSSPTAPQVPAEGTIARVSRILFGGGVQTPSRHEAETSSSEEEDE